MLDRIAALTWHRPKLVLTIVGIFAVVAGVVGHNVEEHLKAAGFTDSSSESERATGLLRDSLGYDANPGIFVVVRDPHGRVLDRRDPAVRREVARLAAALDRSRYVGAVTNPLTAPPREGRPLIAKDGRSLVIPGHITAQDIEDKGGLSTEDAKKYIGESKLHVALG